MSLPGSLAQALAAGGLEVARRYKLGSAVPGLMTPDEELASARADRLVPVAQSGPLASRGYAEIPTSPGAMPPLPPPGPEGYTSDDRAMILRTALARMGAVAQERSDRENLAAGGHLRIASAPWTNARFAVSSEHDETGNRRYTPIAFGPALDPRPAARGPGSLLGAVDLETLTADTFVDLAKKDAQRRMAQKREGFDPLEEQRERQRHWGQNAVQDASWGAAFSATPADPYGAPLGVNGVTP